MSNRTFSDEELTAYLDGEADAELTRAILFTCKDDEVLRARLDDLTIDTRAIAAAFDELTGTAPAMPALPAPALRAQRRWTVGGAVAAALVLGLGVGCVTRGSQQLDGWMDYVAAYQALYIHDTVASLPDRGPSDDDRLAYLAEILGTDLTLPKGPSPLDYRRAQLLGFEGKPLVQIAFLSPVGAPVALCVIASEGADVEIAVTELEGMSTAHWRKNGFSYMLIGGTDSGLIRQEAGRFEETL
ncbi:hypothetical protein N9L47_01510 [Rhodobacteraceae bacterium]|nr:hypothetical protein [Paracoccaceae bacterium]